MNKKEEHKYNNAKNEIQYLKEELKVANEKIKHLEAKVLDLLVLLFAGNKNLRLVHTYIKQKYPNIFTDMISIKNRGDLIMEQIANIKNGFSFRSEKGDL